MDLSEPSILQPRVRIPSTTSKFLSNYILMVTCRKDQNKQKEAGMGPILKNLVDLEKCVPLSNFVQNQKSFSTFQLD